MFLPLQTSEKRKSLLDEMAITVTSKSDEISKLQRELDQIKEDSSSEAEVGWGGGCAE